MRKFIFVLFTSFICTQLYSQNDVQQNFVIGKRYTIKSKILGANREFIIYLPESYNYNDYTRYPVMYLLDGRKFFHSFTGAIAQMSSDASPQIPEMIVVGITSQDRVKDSSPTNSLKGYTGKEEKGLEVSGGADSFIEFIEKELIPHIDENYRSTHHRVFVGYSFTGLPVLHTLFSKPELFNSFLAIDFSAWWDQEVSLKNMNAFFKSYNGSYKDIFISTVDRVNNVIYPEKENKTWKFIQMFDQNHPENIDFGYKKYGYKLENHYSVPLISFIDGIKYIFRGYMVNYDEMYNNPNKIKLRFEHLSDRLGWKIAPREDLMNFFGNQFMYSHIDMDKALFYYKYNTENYPLSNYAWYCLGKAHEKMGEKEKAIIAYKKSLDLFPENKELRKRIKELVNE